MHIGHLIESELTKNRYSIAEVAKEMSKSETAVRKDLKKDKLHMDVVEGYSRVLKINLYALLAKEMEPKKYREPEPEPDRELTEGRASDYKRPSGKKTSKSQQFMESTETVSICFQITPDKKEALLKLLTS